MSGKDSFALVFASFPEVVKEISMTVEDISAALSVYDDGYVVLFVQQPDMVEKSCMNPGPFYQEAGFGDHMNFHLPVIIFGKNISILIEQQKSPSVS